MTSNTDYPVSYRTSKVTNDYSFELKILAKDENTLVEVIKMLRGDANE